MAESADIEAGVARLQDSDSRPKGGPVHRLIVGANAIVLRVARRDAEKGVVGGEELGIRAHAELVTGTRGKTNQPGVTVDLQKIVTRVGSCNKRGAGAVRIQRMGRSRSARAAVGQSGGGTGEESLDL